MCLPSTTVAEAADSEEDQSKARNDVPRPPCRPSPLYRPLCEPPYRGRPINGLTALADSGYGEVAAASHRSGCVRPPTFEQLDARPIDASAPQLRNAAAMGRLASPRDLRQVAGLLRVEALRDRDVVGEELGGDDRDDGPEPIRHAGGNRDGPAAEGAGLADVRNDDGVDAALAKVAKQSDLAFRGRARRREDEHGNAGLDQRDRAVEEVGGRVGVGEDLRELLELQCPLPRRGVFEATPHH